MRRSIVIYILLAAMLLVGKNDVYAQRPVGDTLTNFSDDSTYYMGGYNWSSIPDPYTWFSTKQDFYVSSYSPSTDVGQYECISSEIEDDCLMPGNYIEGIRMETDRPLKILGIAVCAFAEELSDGPVRLDNVLDTSMAGRNTDSLVLYTLTPSGPHMLTGGPWRMEHPNRYMVLPRYDTIRYFCAPSHPELLLMPVSGLYEVMFDKPQVVIDSFVVACTANNNHTVEVWDQGHFRAKCYWEHRPTRLWFIKAFLDTPDTNQTTWLCPSWYQRWIRIAWSRGRTPAGFYWRYFPLIVPIIDPDFDTVLCDMARDVRVADSTDTTLTLMWNGGNAVQWEVVYAEVNSPTAQTVTTTAPMVTLTGLRERTNYLVRVRGMCEWDTEYGPWSDIVDVWTGVHHDDPPDPLSISNLDRFTQMMPNPARGQVTVLSSYRLSRVVVYDLKGNTVLEQEDEGLTTTFDVSALAKGVYVVAIHTPAGIATKRLVVE